MTGHVEYRDHVVTFKPRLPWQERLRAAVHSEARFIVAVMGRRAGKTSACTRIVGEHTLNGKFVFWGAPTNDLTNVGFEMFEKTMRPMIQRLTRNPGNAELYGGGRVMWRNLDRYGTALGRGFDLAVIEEAARVRKLVVYEDLMPTLADRSGKAIAITTPRGRRSWVFEWYNRAMAGDPLYAVVHGPSTENPSPQVREFVEIARENMGDHLFRQEILAEFVEGEGAVFHRIMDNATVPALLDSPAPGCTYVVGTDLAKHQDYTVCVALDVATGAVHGIERYRHVDWPLVKQRVKHFSERWGAQVWIDATGVGDPVFDDLTADGLPVVPIKFTSESKSALVVALCNAMEKGEVSYPPDPVLIGELEAFAYEELPSGRFRYSAPEGMHDDCVMALALAVWGRQRAATSFGGWL